MPLCRAARPTPATCSRSAWVSFQGSRCPPARVVPGSLFDRRVDPRRRWSSLPRASVLQRRGPARLDRLGGRPRDRGLQCGLRARVRLRPAEWFRDAVLASGRACSAIATDDSHDAPDCLNAWTMVRAEERSREAVVDALRAGSFYASNGPSILEARRDGDALEVRCSPARSVRLQSRPGSGSSVSVEYPSRSGRVVDTDPNGLITAARVQAEGDDCRGCWPRSSTLRGAWRGPTPCDPPPLEERGWPHQLRVRRPPHPRRSRSWAATRSSCPPP